MTSIIHLHEMAIGFATNGHLPCRLLVQALPCRFCKDANGRSIDTPVEDEVASTDSGVAILPFLWMIPSLLAKVPHHEGPHPATRNIAFSLEEVP